MKILFHITPLKKIICNLINKNLIKNKNKLQGLLFFSNYLKIVINKKLKIKFFLKNIENFCKTNKITNHIVIFFIKN